MPIKPGNKARYPANWRAIRAEILKRAGDCCEFCGRPNHVWAVRDGAWRFTREEMESLARPGEKVFLLVLTIVHLDHDPTNNDGMDSGAPAIPTYRIEASNLRALCQRCHLRWDASHHQQTAYSARRAPRALGDLFDAHP